MPHPCSRTTIRAGEGPCRSRWSLAASPAGPSSTSARASAAGQAAPSTSAKAAAAAGPAAVDLRVLSSRAPAAAAAAAAEAQVPASSEPTAADLHLAAQLSRLAGLAYKPDAELGTRLAAEGFTLVTTGTTHFTR